MTSQVPLALNVHDTLTCLPSKREKDIKDTSVGKHLPGKRGALSPLPKRGQWAAQGTAVTTAHQLRYFDSPTYTLTHTHPCSQGPPHSLHRRRKHGLFCLLLAFIMALVSSSRSTLLYLLSPSALLPIFF